MIGILAVLLHPGVAVQGCGAPLAAWGCAFAASVGIFVGCYGIVAWERENERLRRYRAGESPYSPAPAGRMGAAARDSARMGEGRLGVVGEQSARASASLGPDSGEVLALTHPGLWWPAVVVLHTLAAVVCLTAPWVWAPWVFGAPNASRTPAELLRMLGWLALMGTVGAAGALAWEWRWPRRRIVFEDNGF